MEAVSLPGSCQESGFAAGAIVQGVVGEVLTPEQFVALGAILGAEGRAALGWSGGDGAAMLARALGAGVCAGGGEAVTHDGCCPAAAAWLGEYYGLAVSLFVEQVGERAFLYWFDQDGLPPDRARLRELERQWHCGGGARAGAGQVGRCEHLAGVNTVYAADAARRIPAGPFTAPVAVAVPGESLWDQTLAQVLERLGCRALRRPVAGMAGFCAARGGFWLEGRTEDGAAVDSGRMLALTALLELERGGEVAVGPLAPAVIDEMGAALGRPVLRLGRDRAAGAVCARAPWLRDALFAAGYLAAAMGREGKTLSQLLERLPRFALRKAEIALHSPRRAVMEVFTSRFRRAEPVGAGVRLHSGGGWVSVVPLPRRRAIRVQAEGPSAEIAEELCGFFADEVRKLDGEGDD